MMYSKRLTDKYCFETQLTFFKSLCISFDLHYSDGQITGHEGVYLNLHILGVFFEFNIYNMFHADEGENDV